MMNENGARGSPACKKADRSATPSRPVQFVCDLFLAFAGFDIIIRCPKPADPANKVEGVKYIGVSETDV